MIPVSQPTKLPFIPTKLLIALIVTAWLGIGSNILVVQLNGYMPVRHLDHMEQGLKGKLWGPLTPNTHLAPLADQVDLDWGVMSIGDFGILLGLAGASCGTLFNLSLLAKKFLQPKK